MDKENKSANTSTPTHLEVTEVLNTLEPEKKEVIMQAFACIRQETFSGPLPPPDMMRSYGDIIPDAPQRILTMAEKQTQHRIECEKAIVDTSKRESILGLVFGFIIAILTLAAAVYLGMNGHDVLAGAIPTSVAALAAVFVINNKKDNGRVEDGK